MPSVTANSQYGNNVFGNFDALGSVDGSAFCSGHAETNGSPITLRGICWDSLPNPTIELSDTIILGSGSGDFSGLITNLRPNTTYYVRAYATNAIGTGYGNALLIRSWMPTNLDVVTYRNGDTIPQVTDSAAWANLTTGAWCYYNNDSANGKIYGKLYNYYAFIDPRGLAPSGCILPTLDDWQNLSKTLGDYQKAGGRMKTSNLWMPPNTGADNSGNFSGLPGGSRLSNGTFAANINYYGEWWTGYPYGGNLLNYRLSFNSAALSLSSIIASDPNFVAYKRTGRSVRCMKQ